MGAHILYYYINTKNNRTSYFHFELRLIIIIVTVFKYII